MPACSRASLACIPCRIAKNKCEGTVPSAIASSSGQTLSSVLADWPCPRCQRLKKDCQWKSAHRTGRPKRTAESIAKQDSIMEFSPDSLSSTPNPLADPDLYDFVAKSLDEGSLSLFSLASDNIDNHHSKAEDTAPIFSNDSDIFATLMASMTAASTEQATSSTMKATFSTSHSNPGTLTLG